MLEKKPVVLKLTYIKRIQEGICDITAADTFEDCIGPIKRIKQHIIGPSIL